MRKILLAGAALLSVAATPAMALSLTYQNGGSAESVQPLSNGVLIEDFGAGGGNPGTYTGTGVFADLAGNPNGTSGVYTAELTSGFAAQPNFGSTGGYAAVVNGGSFTINFATSQVFSFVIGSLDPSNSLRVLFGNGTFFDYTGTALNNNVATGDQTVATQNGRVIIDNEGVANGGIVGAVFTSGQNSFEFDNIVTAVPEPGTWGMMILGFGLAGGALRSRRRDRLAIA